MTEEGDQISTPTRGVKDNVPDGDADALRHDAHVKLFRLFLALVWLVVLWWFCDAKDKHFLTQIADSVVHDGNSDDGLAGARETVHVAIGRVGSSPEEIDWRTVTERDLHYLKNTLAPKSLPTWLTPDREPNKDEPVQFVRFTFRAAHEPVPDPMQYEQIRKLSGGFAALGFAYFFIVLFTSRLKDYLSDAGLVILIIISAIHVWLTFLEGGLFVSPVGQLFTTATVILAANAVAAVNTPDRRRRYWNFSPVAILFIGSLAVHMYSMNRYDPSIQYLLTEAYKGKYILYLFIAMFLGLASIATRLQQYFKPLSS